MFALLQVESNKHMQVYVKIGPLWNYAFISRLLKIYTTVIAEWKILRHSILLLAV